MDPITGMITGGASLLGSIFSSVTNASNTQAQMANQQAMQAQSEQFNANQAAIGRDWNAQAIANQQQFQTQMSNTAYQRASADMKAAGLNPMMMFSSGGPASSPAGSSGSAPTASIGTPTAPMPSKTSPFAGIGDAVKTAVSSMVSAKTVDEMAAKIADLQSDKAVKDKTVGLVGQETAESAARTGLAGAQTSTEGARRDLISQQKATEAESTKLEGARAILAKLGIPAAGVSAIQADAILDLPDSVVRRAAQATYGTKTFGDIVSPIISSATGVGRLGESLKALRDRGYTDTTSEARYPDATFRSTTRRPN